MRPRLDQFERDVMTHMRLWTPHGVRYDEDIFPAFGMRVNEFHRRFAQIICSWDASISIEGRGRDVGNEARRHPEHYGEEP
ncbi:hypothetical protein [Mycobacterium sp. OAE908]|uniref:hypothetical protein n=1 Tax=Mycobacterium sp. OAE908 TaxID=2817899 RepID=UPI001AE8155C